jgi:pseudouridine synthase
VNIRLQKFLADAGVASRRAGEKLIAAGRVRVNGQVVTSMGSKVDPASDRVEVDGARVNAKRKLYVALHKPRGYLCSRHDPLHRKTVHNLLPAQWGNLVTVGRLDRETEGLILLTNDGHFNLVVTHPRFGVRKKYLATIPGRVPPETLAAMLKGVRDGGECLKATKARLLNSRPGLSLVEMELSEGKNREVRRLFESQGLEVEHLKRVQVGPIKLGELPTGKWRTLTEPEIKSLLQTAVSLPPSDSGRQRNA